MDIVALLASSWMIARDVVFSLVVIIAVSVLLREGWSGLARGIVRILKNLTAVVRLIQWYLRREVRGFLKQVDPHTFSATQRKKIEIPSVGKLQGRGGI